MLFVDRQTFGLGLFNGLSFVSSAFNLINNSSMIEYYGGHDFSIATSRTMF